MLEFSGQQVTLKDAAGTVLGVSTIKGWPGDPALDLNPAAYGSVAGGNCAYGYEFPDVDTSSKFYTLEFGNSSILPVTLTQAELVAGTPVILK